MSGDSAIKIAESIAFKLLAAAQAMHKIRSIQGNKDILECMNKLQEAGRILRGELLPKLESRDEKWAELHARIQELEEENQDFYKQLMDQAAHIEYLESP